jgi:hypothetical protein
MVGSASVLASLSAFPFRLVAERGRGLHSLFHREERSHRLILDLVAARPSGRAALGGVRGTRVRDKLRILLTTLPMAAVGEHGKDI